jgi:hypothetical protein
LALLQAPPLQVITRHRDGLVDMAFSVPAADSWKSANVISGFALASSLRGNPEDLCRTPN